MFQMRAHHVHICNWASRQHINCMFHVEYIYVEFANWQFRKKGHNLPIRIGVIVFYQRWLLLLLLLLGLLFILVFWSNNVSLKYSLCAITSDNILRISKWRNAWVCAMYANNCAIYPNANAKTNLANDNNSYEWKIQTNL